MKKIFNSFLIGFFLFAMVIAPVYQVGASYYNQIILVDEDTSGGTTSTVTSSDPSWGTIVSSGLFNYGASLNIINRYAGSVDIQKSRWVSRNLNYSIDNLNDSTTHYYIIDNFDYWAYINDTSSLNTNASTIRNAGVNNGYLDTKSFYKSEWKVTILDSSNNVVTVDADTGATSAGNSINGDDKKSIGTYISQDQPITGISNLQEGNYTAVFQASPYVYVMHETCASGWYGDYCGWTHLGARTDRYVQQIKYSNVKITIPFTIYPAPKITFTSVSDNKISTQPITLFDSITQKMIKGAKYGSNNVKISWQADNIIDSTNMVCTTPKGTEPIGIISGYYLLPANLTSNNTSSVSCVEGAPYVPPAVTTVEGCYTGTRIYGSYASGGSIHYLDKDNNTNIISDIWSDSFVKINYKDGTSPQLTYAKPILCSTESSYSSQL